RCSAETPLRLGSWPRFASEFGRFFLPMNLTSVATSRCDVPARESAGGIVAPLNAARTAQRAVPTRFRGSMREDLLGRKLSTARRNATEHPPEIPKPLRGTAPQPRLASKLSR